MTTQGCVRCGKSEESMPLNMHKGNMLCDECLAIELPPVTFQLCAICKANPVTNQLQPLKSLMRCDACLQKEAALQAANNSPAAVQARLDTLAISKKVDESIQVRADIFNAKTVAIVELKAAIDADPAIANKPYALAETLKAKFEKLQTIIFEHQEVIVDANNEQRAIQTYLNSLANSLRAEEREKLRLQDINYKPNQVKPVVTKIKTTGTEKKKKATKAEIAKAAKEIGMAEFTLTAFVIQTGGDLEAAVTKIKASLAAAKAGQ